MMAEMWGESSQWQSGETGDVRKGSAMRLWGGKKMQGRNAERTCWFVTCWFRSSCSELLPPRGSSIRDSRFRRTLIVFVSLGKHIHRIIIRIPASIRKSQNWVDIWTGLELRISVRRSNSFWSYFSVFMTHRDELMKALQFVKAGTRVGAFAGILSLQLSLKLRRQSQNYHILNDFDRSYFVHTCSRDTIRKMKYAQSASVNLLRVILSPNHVVWWSPMKASWSMKVQDQQWVDSDRCI